VIAAERLALVRAELDAGGSSLDGPDGTVVDAGVAYRHGEPVLIRVRRRGRRYDITDDGGAVRLARRPPGWLERAEHVVSAEGFNVNRRGVVFVPAVAGRDIALLAVRLADTSRAVYLALLDLEVVVRP
jgi:hypothetical protein